MGIEHLIAQQDKDIQLYTQAESPVNLLDC